MTTTRQHPAARAASTSNRTTGRTASTRIAAVTDTEAAVRVATYRRISTDEDHQPFSLESQQLRLDAFIASQPGWEATRAYTDQFSGAYAERPGLDQALRDARLGAYDVLLVYRVDRFARSLKVLVGLLEELDCAGVAFRSATESIDTATPTGRMLVQLLGVFAEFERATIIDRVIAGMERKAARGHWPGGTLPYGLDVDADKRLVAHPDELPLVEAIFERYTKDRYGAERIAAEINATGRRTRTGRPFSRQGVLHILRNRAYLGQVYFRGSWHPSAPAPLLDPALFDAAQAVLAERSEDYDRRFTDRHPAYLLSGLITCGACGRRYIGAAATGKTHRYRYYMCWTRNRYGPEHCGSERIRADELETAVFDALIALYADPDVIARAAGAQHQALAAQARHRQAELRTITTDLAKTEAAVERYMAAFEAGTLPDDVFGERVRALGAKAKTLAARRAELAHTETLGAAALPTDADIAAVAGHLRRVAHHAPDDIRKAVTQAFVADLRVDQPRRVKPTFRILPALPPPAPNPDDNPEPGSGVRAMTDPVGRDRIEVNYKVPAEDPLYGKDNALVTGNWPTPPDADPESALIGQSYVCSVGSNFPMVVTDPGSWIWAGAGVRAGQVLPGLVGPEFDQVNPDEPTPRPLQVLSQSPVGCGAVPTYSDVSYYVAGSGAGVFDSGTEDWICALPDAAQCPRLEPAVRRVIQDATANILRAFAAGPAGRAHPARELIPSPGGRAPLLGTS